MLVEETVARRRVDGDVVVQARGLTKVFGTGETAVRAVDGVDLDVRRGEIALIMGPSGSGKTTLLTMIGGLLRPTSGTVYINGLNITGMMESELYEVRRRTVGFVFQSFNLLEALDARENVEVALNLAGERGSGARRKAEAVLVNLGLQERLKFKTRALSGGEKQRVSIARALANDPPVILADEPTGNLDSKHGYDIVALLRDIAREQERTVIIVSHDHRIREVADRVLWLEDGRFKEIGRLARDPVCGMSVEMDRAVKLERNGHVFYFCSPGCAREFQESEIWRSAQAD